LLDIAFTNEINITPLEVQTVENGEHRAGNYMKVDAESFSVHVLKSDRLHSFSKVILKVVKFSTQLEMLREYHRS